MTHSAQLPEETLGQGPSGHGSIRYWAVLSYTGRGPPAGKIKKEAQSSVSIDINTPAHWLETKDKMARYRTLTGEVILVSRSLDNSTLQINQPKAYITHADAHRLRGTMKQKRRCCRWLAGTIPSIPSPQPDLQCQHSTAVNLEWLRMAIPEQPEHKGSIPASFPRSPPQITALVVTEAGRQHSCSGPAACRDLSGIPERPSRLLWSKSSPTSAVYSSVAERDRSATERSGEKEGAHRNWVPGGGAATSFFQSIK
ncbi:arrestin domain-containing protein 2 isoform X1 [Lates japonicus]|uniref:Arrestin domain-containing protein 2 isoform X1 n=1 Tax=Lates japonicus TaxID=270547 RepID=A0AAD3M9J1_LATJO|nr:arrestin domain-containing protein 2 isoform X1 [Lates japonicus]